MNNKKHTQQDLGYKRPKNHTVESKNHILELIRVEKKVSQKVKLTSPWIVLSGIAASLLFVFFLTKTNNALVIEETEIEEDVFVTSLLMDTLLLEEAELDQAIQEALLDDFENDLALN
jgi:hypothetical protein